jgi:hypothetical protein
LDENEVCGITAASTKREEPVLAGFERTPTAPLDEGRQLDARAGGVYLLL